MDKTQYNYKIYFTLIGILATNICFYISFYLRFNSFSISDGYSQDGIGYDYIYLLLNLFFLLFSSRKSGFLFFKTSAFSKVFTYSIRDTFFMLLGYGLFIMVVKGAWFSREFILTYSVLYGISLTLIRISLFSFFRYKIDQARKNKKIILFGSYTDIVYLMENVVDEHSSISHFFCYEDKPNHYNQYYLNLVDDFFNVISSENHINEAYIVYSNKKYFSKIYYRCLELGIRVKIIPAFYEEIESHFDLEPNFKTPILKLQVEPLEDPFNAFIKRCFDLVFSTFVLLVVFPPLMFILGIFIKLSSKGPIFFKQTRSGLNHKTFSCWKFRTMKVIDQKEADKIQASKDDPRITKVGAFLRRTNLDEFPQFINVFLGDMSVVGPRPHPISLNERFGNKLSFYMARHHCKPGVTGWAQANGYRGETKEDFLMEKRIEFDRYYIYHWSFSLDIKIIFLTVWKMITGDERAY